MSFKSLAITADWVRFEAIIELRNNIEHYRTDVPMSGIREVFGNAFFVIDQFCNKELRRKPYEMFGEGVWDVFLEEETFWKDLRASVDEANKDLKWQNQEMEEVAACFSCVQCSSRLLKVLDANVKHYEDQTYQCVTCDHVNEFNELVEPALEEQFGAANYASFKDTGELYADECAGCSLPSYLVEQGLCVVCGYSPYVICERCHAEYHFQHYCEHCDYRDSMDYRDPKQSYESMDDLSEVGSPARKAS